ncbi:hypothetical protein U472_11765 [Orenia metallireducens]|uniref:Methyl-accepting chemotaxis sensory transducer with Cache sensor n=1 Tax=Orenia metallireducens TaxID=1413210 RepID=A0A1C0A8T9_9FIRM|nr:methyl-accepting chemotaxis protein [Orenia metallireducens]OCL26648.1 hypothetical protein U472_11765 [Orenia metallireducens]
MKLKQSFKTKLILILITVLVVIILSTSYIYVSRNKKYVEETAYKTNMALSQNLTKIVDNNLENIKNMMTVLSKIDLITQMEINYNLDNLLKEVVKEYQAISQIYMMNKSGMQIYKTSGVLGDRSDREYFQKAIKGEANYSDVIISKSEKVPIIVSAVPIKRDGEVVGVLGASIDLTFVSDLAAKTKSGETGYGYVVDRNGRVIAHPDKELVDKMADLSNLAPVKEVIKGKQGKSEYTFKGEDKLASYVPTQKAGWGIIVQLPAKEAFVKVKEDKIFAIIMIIISVVIAVAIAWYLARYITNPLIEAMNFAQKIAAGKLDVKQIGSKSEDEFGKLTEALNTMHDSLREVMIDLVKIIENLSAYSEELSASAEEGNATIETTNHLIEDMSASIQQISASAQEVTSFAQESASQTEVGGENVRDTIEGMKEINKAVKEAVKAINDLVTNSTEVEKIIELITNIADQTNLLALNAAIEAARAGEHGQGFSVVAEEIRALAEESAKATNEIADLIKKIRKKSDVGLKAVKEVEVRAKEGEALAEQTGEVFVQIEESSEETSAHIQQTAASTQSLAERSDEIMSASQNIRNMSSEITNSSQELAEMAQQLQNLINRFEI